MVQVTELGYMGIGVKDLDEWKNFASKVVGFELVDEGERDRCYLRMMAEVSVVMRGARMRRVP